MGVRAQSQHVLNLYRCRLFSTPVFVCRGALRTSDRIVEEGVCSALQFRSPWTATPDWYENKPLRTGQEQTGMNNNSNGDKKHPNWYETTTPQGTITPDWYETTQLNTCSVNAGRVVGSTGAIGVGSPYAYYGNNENCVWEIQVPQGSFIQFTWDYFSLEGSRPWCGYDYVDISDYATGQSLTGRLCGSVIPPSVTTNSNLALVTFISDGFVTRPGFRLRFEAVPGTATPDWYETTTPPGTRTPDWYETTTPPGTRTPDWYETTTPPGTRTPDWYETTTPPGTRTPDWYETTQLNTCSVNAGRVVGSTGAIGVGSPYAYYGNNENCVWEIQVPQGSFIQFTWDYFSLEGSRPWCGYDYVDISDYATGQSLTGRLCGSVIPPSVTTNSNLALVTFISDGFVTRPGFRLRFEAVPGNAQQ
ncbi:exoskeleton protein RP43-like [Macrobrachium nipponense]|uniref:exoskeleton protein RP43-like n=1 Tax=Macrobrachium nipponense TaxID=159736 RepID=UPI0030C85E81